MKFIKVTIAKNGKTTFINANAILNFRTSPEDENTTDIFIRTENDSCFVVKESIYQILEMLK